MLTKHPERRPRPTSSPPRPPNAAQFWPWQGPELVLFLEVPPHNAWTDQQRWASNEISWEGSLRNFNCFFLAEVHGLLQQGLQKACQKCPKSLGPGMRETSCGKPQTTGRCLKTSQSSKLLQFERHREALLPEPSGFA